MAKRSDQLFDYLVRIADNLRQTAVLFEQNLADLSHAAALAKAVKEHETKGDTLIAELVTLLNSTYITPLEREDFLQLAVKLDDIVDGLEACTVRFDLYQIPSATPVMKEFAATIRESAAEILAAMDKLRARKLLDIQQHTRKLNELEKHGDQLLRHSLRELFAETRDAVTIIKYKELYEILEDVTDRCEDVSDVLESVIVKNA
ncbi:hypothetical protein GCM10010885_10910 [Alicyclobacillus cellulosilyticus]|uniref:Phosphate transport regulator n=1 Tax=Alicyclobacillus cellulosilyticus TaxID=1003997 RepID=A0A917NIQ3_9BACL|nr:DUF47 family protein [Alicyclobacillus cellulosilyticus]GGJ03485.1 hypothetical protein GCM10010885_10910 [Alicyclobacillus cellulosilyticus]